MDHSQQEGPITIAISRRVKTGMENEFNIWAEGIASAAKRYPGHLGAGHIRPATPDGEHTMIYRFDTIDHYKAWQSSDEHAYWIEASKNLIQGEPRIQRATGLEFWFQDPATCHPDGPPRPPRWKQALLTEIGLYPTVLVVSYLIGLVLISTPYALNVLATTIVAIIIMTWLIMPLITKTFSGWLRGS